MSTVIAKIVTKTYSPQATAAVPSSNTPLQTGDAQIAEVLGISETPKPQTKQSPTNKVEAKKAAHDGPIAVIMIAVLVLSMLMWTLFVRQRRAA
jgi:hypothetical protein